MPVSKWTILLLACAAAFGSYYSFETPSVLHNAMYRHYGFTDDKEFELYFSLIYSLYALPNTVIPLVGGLLADKFGNKKVMLLFSSFVLIGSTIETIACFHKSIALFLFGRFIFGCGAETLNVCCSIVISKWFKGQELALALAINLSLSKLATVVTDWTSPLMYHHIGIENNSCYVTLLCFICYLLTILLLKYDTDEMNAMQMQIHANRLLNTFQHHLSLDHIEQQQHGNEYVNEETQSLLPVDIKHSSNAAGNRMIELTTPRFSSQHEKEEYYQQFPALINNYHNSSRSNNSNNNENTQLFNKEIKENMTNTAINSNTTSSSKYNTTSSNNYSTNNNNINTTSSIELYTFMGFSLPVWLLFLFTFIMYGTFIPFTNWSNVILIRFYYAIPHPSSSFIAYREMMAARLQSIPNFISVFLTPVFGLSVDYYGNRTVLLALAGLLLICAHSIIYTQLMDSAIFPLVLIGLAFSIFGSVIWPCIPITVAPDHQGTAYGVMTSFQNAGQFIVPLLLQFIYRQYVSFVPCEGFFIFLSVICTVVAISIWFVDEVYNAATLRLPDISLLEEDHQQNSTNGLYASAMGGKTHADGVGFNGSDGNIFGVYYGSMEEGKYRLASPDIAVGRSDSNHTHYSCNEPFGGGDVQQYHIPLSSSNGNHNGQYYSAASSLSSHGMLSSSLGAEECFSSSEQLSNNNNSSDYSSSNYTPSTQQCQHEQQDPPSPLLNESKFARLRAFTMPESRPSLSHNLYTLAEESSQLSGSSSRASRSSHYSLASNGIANHNNNNTTSNDPTNSRSINNSACWDHTPLRPIEVIALPNVVHHSKEFYDRANIFQFPREDPLELRRLISERDRAYSDSNLGIAGMSQSAPAESHMNQYQRYRQEQIMAHNQLSPDKQKQQLLLGGGPVRRALRSMFF